MNYFIDNRIVVFSPILRDQEEISSLVKIYFQNNFNNYSNIKIVSFPAPHIPEREQQIGHQYEVLVVFDRRISIDRSNKRMGLIYYQSLELSLDMTKNLCISEGIPYLTYEGEIARNIPEQFITRLESIKSKITRRLDEIP